MDCCNTKQERTRQEGQKDKSVKGGGHIVEIKKNMMLWAVIGVLFLAVLFLIFKASSITGNMVTGTDSRKLDTTGWSANEKMNYEMHGTMPARLQGKTAASQSSGSGMVGGC